MKNIGHLMKQAQKMQDDMARVQERIASMESEGQSGAGLVKVVTSGKGDIKSITIDPTLLSEDIEILQDLIIAAFNDSKSKMDQKSAEEMKSVTGGFPIPDGIKFPF